MAKVRFDGHIHPPEDPDKFAEMVYYAMERSLDLMILTPFENQELFEPLVESLGSRGRSYEVLKLGQGLYRVMDGFRETVLAEGLEFGCINGTHVISWMHQGRLDYRMGYESTSRQIREKRGVVVWPHPKPEKLFHGIGWNQLLKLHGRIRRTSIAYAAESSGQLSSFMHLLCDKPNVRKARKHGIAVVAGSDMHGNQLEEYKKVGLFYNEVDADKLELGENLRVSLYNLVKKHPEAIKIGGRKNNVIDVFRWLIELQRQKRGK